MYQEHSDFSQNTHLLGVTYLSNFLDRVGFAIVEVNADPDHHYQLLVKVNDKTLMIAVRTACHPNIGKIDQETREKLIIESEKLKAAPHFAWLSLTAMSGSDFQVGCSSEGEEHKVIFHGMTAVR